MTIFTRYQTEGLYQLSCRLTEPFARKAINGSSADGYIAELLGVARGWICNMDEDAFLYSQSRLLELRAYMKENGYHYCGMREGGTLPIRAFNPSVCNPFFNLFDTDAMAQEFRSFDAHDFCNGEIAKAFEPETFRSKYRYGLFEPYYPQFLWLRMNFKCLFLNATVHSDGISTILFDHLNRPLLLHTWYARNFALDNRRYVAAFEHAQSEARKEQETGIPPSEPALDADVPTEEVTLHHPCWSDTALLYANGAFARSCRGNQCGDAGRWSRQEDGSLFLEWFDWEAESFRIEASDDYFLTENRTTI